MFARDLETGATCSAAGEPFADPDQATCVVFDSFEAARAFCESGVQALDRLRFDIFDATGRANPPLLTVLHPARAGALETDGATLSRRRAIGWAMVAAAVPTLLLAYRLRDGGHQIFAGFIGLSLLVSAGRLLWFNLGVRETERWREERLARALSGRSDRA